MFSLLVRNDGLTAVYGEGTRVFGALCLYAMKSQKENLSMVARERKSEPRPSRDSRNVRCDQGLLVTLTSLFHASNHTYLLMSSLV